MVNCAVPSCKNDSRRQTKQNSNVTFHRFPKNEEILRKWVDALQRPDWEPTIRSFVCSLHFSDSVMYFSKSGLRKLLPDAVPEHSLEHELKPKSKRKGKSSKIIMPHMYVSRGQSPDGKKKRFSLDIKKEPKQKDDSPTNRKLKKRIVNLTKLSKRRRLRCNALYASLNRIRKKVSGITQSLKELQQKVSMSEELGRMLSASGVSPAELFHGLRRERASPEPQEEDEFFYSEIQIPQDLDSIRRAPKRQITVYNTVVPPLSPPLPGEEGDCIPPDHMDVQVSIVKTECDPLPPLFVDTRPPPACRVCLRDVPLHAIPDELRGTYETLAGSKLEFGPDALCSGCIATLQRCQRFTEMSRKAEIYHSQEAATESRD